MSWPKTADGQHYIFEGQVLLPVDPKTGVAILMLRPLGGMGVGIPPIEQGPSGMHAEIATAINLTELAADDPTAASASWTVLTPPDNDTSGLYKLNLALHKGLDGEPGDTVLDPDDFDGAAPGNFPAVNAAGDGFELVPQKVGDRYLPATIVNSGPNDANTTVAVIAVDPQDSDWRPDIEAETVVTGNDVRVDLVARLNGQTTGNVVGRCHGVAPTERLTICSAPPAGSADGFDKVPAGQAVNIYIRTELQSGSGSYTTTSATTLAAVKVRPVP